MNLKEAIQVHDRLNPLLWNEDMTLKEDVRDRLLEITNYFIDNAQFHLDVLDAHIVGSNASFNYTEHSDLDLHLIVNYADITCSEELARVLCDFQRSSFNNSYDITIHGVNVELYLEDVNALTLSNGIYSLFEERWIKVPQPITDVPEIDITGPVEVWAEIINDALESENLQDVVDIINRLYMIRKNSLAVDGEYGKGNQLFKEIRNLGLLDKLKERKQELTSDLLTLEAFI